tara:strand:+ start:32 stop:403 length:372 start_codon:yes stop_codon:yes gene_type:complete
MDQYNNLDHLSGPVPVPPALGDARIVSKNFENIADNLSNGTIEKSTNLGIGNGNKTEVIDNSLIAASNNNYTVSNTSGLVGKNKKPLVSYEPPRPEVKAETTFEKRTKQLEGIFSASTGGIIT